MTPNEILTLSISGIALVVSGTTLYLTFFHKKLSAMGCLIAYNTESDDDPKSGHYEFSVANTGSVEILVRSIEVDVTGPSAPTMLPIIRSDKLPAVLKPGQIVLIDFDLPSYLMLDAAKRKNKILIEFHVLSPKSGSMYLCKHLEPVNEDLEINRDGWEPFLLSAKT